MKSPKRSIFPLAALLILLFSSSACAQSIEKFRIEFKNCLNENFQEKDLEKLFRVYARLLTPHSDVTNLASSIKGEKLIRFPLQNFKSERLYLDNISWLINSDNPNHRILAYLVIAGAGDVSFEDELIQKLNQEKEKACLIWSGMALLHLGTTHTTPLFDFLVDNETFGDAHMIPLYVRLNADSLRQTAYRRIKSENIKAKVLAAQILAYTPLTPETEKLLINAVIEWDMNIKGYAIFSLKELRIGNLLPAVRPLVDSTKVRAITLEALANSPTENDRAFVINMINEQDTVSDELLDCLYESKSIDNLKMWLTLLYTKPIPKKYYFSVPNGNLINSEELVPNIQDALLRIQDPEILSELVRALKGRTDEKSTTILISLLSHNNSSVRYWSADALQGNPSDKVKRSLPEFLSSVSLREVALTNLAIENNMDNLHDIFENILNTERSLDWQRSAIEYLSMFPKDRHKLLFRKILKDKKEDTFIKRNAALGLGRLKDVQSIDLIISVARQESSASDFNAQTFLAALGMIKGNKAKAEILRYKDSDEETVRELVEELIKTW